MLSRRDTAVIVARCRQAGNERGASLDCHDSLDHREALTFKGVSMKRMLASLLGASVLFSASMLQPALAQGKKPTARVESVRRERHPKIHAAIGALEAAKTELEHADSDFGGHKKDAIESVDNALKQLRLALQFEKY